MTTPIIDALEQHSTELGVSFHMPGHKGNDRFINSSFLKCDITELDYSDNLYCPSGIIKESQDHFADSLHADEIYYLVNGSTAGVISSLLALSGLKRVLFSRNIHLSAVSGMILAGISPEFIYGSRGHYISENDIINAVRDRDGIDALFLTYPDYYGDCFDIVSVCREAHKKGIIVVVDSAHGAAFPFSDLLPTDCGEAGADIWTISTHKTLSALNQSAVLCVSDKNNLGPDMKRYINIVQTTSPSYPMLASIEFSLAEMSETGRKDIGRLFDIVNDYKNKIISSTDFSIISNDSAYDSDFTMIRIGCSNINGFMLSKILSERNIYVEAEDESGVLLLTSVHNISEDFDCLLNALNDLPECTRGNACSGFNTVSAYKDDIAVEPRKAFFSECIYTVFDEAAGKICCDPIGFYPPGIPVLLPGSVIDNNKIAYIEHMIKMGCRSFGIHDNMIRVIKG